MTETPHDVEDFASRMRRGGVDAVREMCLFCEKSKGSHERVKEVAGQLEAKSIPYAIAGGLAMAVHGAYCGTWELIVVVQQHNVGRARALLRTLTRGLGFVEADAVAVAGIPDPVDVRVQFNGVSYLRLVSLIEMKLASASNLGRLVRDSGDVQELIKRRRLPKSFAGELRPQFREAFLSLWCEPEEPT